MKMRRGGEEGHKDVDAPEFSANDWPMIYDRATEETPSKNGYSAVYREY